MADAHLSGDGERSEPILEPWARSPMRCNQPWHSSRNCPGHAIERDVGGRSFYQKRMAALLALPFLASAMDSTYAPALAAFTMNSERMFSAIPLK
jgi:hypothetical protein